MISKWTGAAAFALIVASAAAAKDVTVDVDSASGPWDVAANSKLMPYGKGNEKPPTIVKFDIAAGKVEIMPAGTTDTGSKKGVASSGIDNKEVDDQLVKKKRFPSFYTPKVLYPVNQHALIAAFVDDKGVVVGRPFAVGSGVRVSLPDGATGVALGFNDVDFANNRGALKVTVDTPD